MATIPATSCCGFVLPASAGRPPDVAVTGVSVVPELDPGELHAVVNIAAPTSAEPSRRARRRR
jgi:hypothetical protein